MKLKFISCIIIILITTKSCINNNVQNQNVIQTKEYNFLGISSFTKGKKLADIQFELKSKKVPFRLLNEEYSLIFDLFKIPYSCCPSRKVLYIPEYKVGNLVISNIFLLFYDSELALLISTEITDTNYNVSLIELKKFFVKKYIDTSGSTQSNTDFDAYFINARDSISIEFNQEIYNDSAYFFGGKSVPTNSRLEYSKHQIEVFKNELQLQEKIKLPKLPVRPSIGRAGFSPANPTMMHFQTIFSRLYVTFPNTFAKCCKQQEMELKHTQDSIKKSLDKSIIDDL